MAEPSSPPGWPADVRPPSAPDWERTAVNWLLDLCPPDYRAHEVLLANDGACSLRCRARELGSRRSTPGSGNRADHLRDVVPADVVDAAIAAYEREGARLARTARAVRLVEEALRGEQFQREAVTAPPSTPTGSASSSCQASSAAPIRTASSRGRERRCVPERPAPSASRRP